MIEQYGTGKVRLIYDNYAYFDKQNITKRHNKGGMWMTLEERAWTRDRADELEKRFHKAAINAGEFAEYLGLCRQITCEKIRSHQLPGQRNGDGSYLIPIMSIALWEARLSKTKEGDNKNV